MMVRMALLRCVKIKADFLRDSVDAALEDSVQSIQHKLRDRYGPMMPGLKIFMRPGYSEATVGVEIMSFEVKEAHVAQAGIAMADPLDEREVRIADGGLVHELRRIGIHVEWKNVQWRVAYSVEGN